MLTRLQTDFPDTPIQSALIRAARDINGILDNSILSTSLDNIHDDMLYSTYKDLKTLLLSIDEARVDAFRDIEKLRLEFKHQIDDNITKPIKAKMSELDGKIKAIERQKALDSIKAKPVETPVKTAPAPRYRKTWEFEVISRDDVPVQYTKIVIDEPKIKLAIKAGVREIKGVRIYERKVLV